MGQHSDEVDQLLRAVLPQAPEVLHHVFSLEGANEVLLGLNTVESKVAYLVQIIAIELYKASKAISPKNISYGPNDLRFHILRSNDLFVSHPYNIMMLDLGELEDLYYAACAKLKELLQGVDILLTNGFKGVHDAYFTYHHEPLRSLGPISIGAFRDSLLIHESILYSNELQSLLNRGVIEKNSSGNKHSCRHKASPGDSTTQHGIQHGNREGTEKYINLEYHTFEQNRGWRAEVEGLQDKSNMSCGMVFGELAEKYRPMAMNAAAEGSMINRTSTPEAPRAFEEEILTRKYISPYNLNERAKKLNVPGGPEMPCICDPECICAPLCASDPTQNCLCEENGLFVRVTEGMDIDDLDVPDLVRRKRQPSEASESSTASLNTTDGASARWPLYSTPYVDAVTPLDEQYGVVGEVEKQIREQKTEVLDNVTVPIPMLDTASQLDDVLSMSDMSELSVENDGLCWQDRLSMSPLKMSDFTHHELTQPFSKQCDHPPKRQSVAERLFKTKTSSMAARKKRSTIDQPMQGHNINGSTTKLEKQTKKRSLADISFTGLRFTRRRGSQGRGS
ncbi:MAG: hypothetical protein ASARMPREDX12_003321 [Alectoria sarmentosa]|nr:MAG: hypothetical protein ASARMPREDX12_003321 [Alectoria sarmentosa]CAD6588814.1 MAG: hypothetical protein ASARMPRED_003735 [Alectoria sarmentosa]